jgi:hypothetical protein
MKTIKDALPAEITYGEIRLVAAKARRDSLAVNRESK